jgi:hypothetical protein
MRHLSPTEPYRDLYLVSLVQKPDRLLQLRVVVVFLYFGPEPYLLNYYNLLCLPGFLDSLGLFETVLTEIEYLAYGRLCSRRDLDEIEIPRFRNLPGLLNIDYPELRPVGVY